MKYFILLLSIVVLSGCGGESEQEKYARMRNEQLGKEQMAQQLEADRKNPPPTEEPEPTEAPTPTPRDKFSDTIYSTHGNFSVTFGDSEWKDGILVYKTVEVDDGEAGETRDIVWVMPSGVIVVTNKYKDRVKKIQ